MEFTHKYKVAILRVDESFAVGIERYGDGGPEWIGSFYLSYYSRKTAFQFAITEIRKQLGVDDNALIRVNDENIRNKRKWFEHYSDIELQFYHHSKFPESLALAYDALLRKSDITETL
ncbi:hypothetical protein H4O14_02040 [Bacillus sp. PAMC26568]|nr:hypothetical protein H4O14_02040 [Bacillus sp. PAMC26568]